VNRLIFLLLLAVFAKQIAWSVFVPLWQTPDEQAHYGQVNFTSELNINELTTQNQSKEIASSENFLGVMRDSLGNNRYTYHPEFNIPYSNSVTGIYENEIKRIPKLNRTEFVFKEATNYPPLYYRIAAGVNNLVKEGSLFDRVFAARILSGLILCAIVYFVFKTSRLIKNNHEALVLAILVGWQPMLTFVHSGVTSDTLFNLLFTCLICVGIKIIAQGISVTKLLAALVIIILGFMTKPQANIMVFAFFPSIVISLFKQGKIKFNRQFIILLAVALAVIIIGMHQILSQFLLTGGIRIPNTEGGLINLSVTPLEHVQFTLNHTYREVLPWYWGVFRWLSLGLPDWLRQVTNLLTLTSFVGIILYLFNQFRRRTIDSQFWIVIYSLISIFVYFIAISIFDFGFRQSHGFSFGIQGRYFFPVIFPQMIIFLIGLQELVPFKWRSNLGKLLAMGMIGLSIGAFFWLVGSYYQLQWPVFFIQASQYKPVWIKFPINLLILLMYIISSAFILGTWLKIFYDKKTS